eukprot:gene14314-15803_t
MQAWFLLSIGVQLFVWTGHCQDTQIVTYWGQNSAWGQDSRQEKDLIDICGEGSPYDIINVGFVQEYFDEQNSDRMPGLNFAGHCKTPIDMNHKTLFSCPGIERGIRTCQQNGKKVLIAIGGPKGKSSFDGEAQGEKLAENIWNLFLGGKDLPDLRPFSSAVLDGVNVMPVGGTFVGYPAFIRHLFYLAKRDSTRKYLITASPSCNFPDSVLGPGPNKALQTAVKYIDHLYIRFYGSNCGVSENSLFEESLEAWLDFVKRMMQRDGEAPLIYIGVPALERASPVTGCYQSTRDLREIYKINLTASKGVPSALSLPNLTAPPNITVPDIPAEASGNMHRYRENNFFGGFMIWDASWDQTNIQYGKSYSERLLIATKNFDEQESENFDEQEEEEHPIEPAPTVTTPITLPTTQATYPMPEAPAQTPLPVTQPLPPATPPPPPATQPADNPDENPYGDDNDMEEQEGGEQPIGEPEEEPEGPEEPEKPEETEEEQEEEPEETPEQLAAKPPQQDGAGEPVNEEDENDDEDPAQPQPPDMENRYPPNQAEPVDDGKAYQEESIPLSVDAELKAARAEKERKRQEWLKQKQREQWLLWRKVFPNKQQSYPNYNSNIQIKPQYTQPSYPGLNQISAYPAKPFGFFSKHLKSNTWIRKHRKGARVSGEAESNLKKPEAKSTVFESGFGLSNTDFSGLASGLSSGSGDQSNQRSFVESGSGLTYSSGSGSGFRPGLSSGSGSGNFDA